MSQRTRVEVRRTSHVHQMPHTGRAHSGPVTSTTVQNTPPTSAVTTASASVPVPEKYFLIRKYRPVIASPVVATEDGSVPEGKGRITIAATQAAMPSTIATQFAMVSATLSRRTRYWIEQTKLMKKSRNAVQADGT